MSDVSEKARMQLNADKTMFFCFHKTTQARNRENDQDKLMAALFGQRHSTSYPCTQTNPTERPYRYRRRKEKDNLNLIGNTKIIYGL